MHCRIDFVDMAADTAALDRLANGFNHLWDTGVIQANAQLHDVNFFNGIHHVPQFMPWHRWLLLTVEQALQAFDSRIVLPYWDWTRADSRNLDVEPWKSFFGGRNNTDGRFDHWTYTRRANDGGNTLPSIGDIRQEVDGPSTYRDFRALECGSHFPGHTWTGGTMQSGESPLDPLFYLHHNNLDRLWAMWQLNNPTAVQYTTDAIGCDNNSPAGPVSLNDPMIGGATPASMLDHRALGYRYPRDIPLEVEVATNGSTPNFISGDAPELDLVTATVDFNDVPSGDTVMRAALFEVVSCEPLVFEIENGPTGSFTALEPGPFPFPVADSEMTTAFRIWVLFTGGAAGSIDPGGVMTVVARNADGDEVGRWNNIPLTANSVERPTAAVALVLDESGSMLSDAGNGRIRIDVLRDAAKTIVDHFYDDNALALISFADAADTPSGLAIAGPIGSMARQAVRDEIDLHGPASNAPLTSIGAGLQEAAGEFSTSPIAGDFAVHATVVFTDGIETRAPFIADVDELLNERVYAVGIADAANVNNDTLVTLASGSDGFMLVEGALDADDDFLLEKFFIQILAGVTNQDMVRDPSGVLTLGEIARVPFSIAQSDIGFDTVTLTRAPHFVLSALQAPDGTIILPQDLPPGGHRIGHHLNGYRVTLPIVKDGVAHWEGEWTLLMTLGLKHRNPNVTHAHGLSHDTAAFGEQQSLPYEALVHARSNLNMRVRLEQEDVTPGSLIALHATLTEYGQPLRGPAVITAIATDPDGNVSTVSFEPDGDGSYVAYIVGAKTGAYRFRVIASGRSFRGAPFTREHLATALIGRKRQGPSSGGSSGDPSGGQPGGQSGVSLDDLCRLLACFEKRGVFDDRFREILKELGIDGDAAKRCIDELCRKRDPARIRDILARRTR